MDVHAAGIGERMLRRVIALLVALAILAERTAGRSAPVRLFVLWILRRAETVAVEFVFEQTGMPPAVDEIARSGNGPEDASRLAARFRALAAALCALLPIGSWLGRRSAQRGFALEFLAPVSGRDPVGRTARPYDTS